MQQIRIFFSWQTDSPSETNRNAIRRALENAKEVIESKRSDVDVVLDEATRGTPGSPDIPSTILQKITQADVFVADITTINRTKDHDPPRPCPNPNVIYELGYAVARRGWFRTIALFNKAHGEFPSDLPFDIAKQRVSTFDLASTPSAGETPIPLTDWIEDILDSPLDQLDESVLLDPQAATKDARDLRTLQRLLLNLDIPTFKDFLDRLPHRIDDSIFWYSESFLGSLESGVFHLYDAALDDHVRALADAWQRTLAHGEQYDSRPGARSYVFWNPGDLPLPDDRQAIWDEIDDARHDAAKALASLCNRIREEYVAIDLVETSAAARRRYADFIKLVDPPMTTCSRRFRLTPANGPNWSVGNRLKPLP